MNSQEALNKIKEGEGKASEIIAQAKKEAEKILVDTELEKVRIIDAARQKVRMDTEKLKQEIEDKTKQEVLLIEKKAADDIRALKEKAGSRIDKAAELIQQRID